MRYRENSAEQVGAAVDEQMMLGTASYSLLAGLLLCALGLRARKYWLAMMGAVFVASSSAYLFSRLFSG
ncbi:hypothetical protein ACW73L_14020 [Methylolobus aquaticus]|uniref:hypothetical protein n=1 Tax=Methylotetracoccus oryzae TaxID=1919059 RepID=UPI001021FD9E|nr:hypothetical protein [Methylotetracoccus oryzae]RYU60026.1 hypothetical protein EWI61_08090 [Methylolobus aquaticus]